MKFHKFKNKAKFIVDGHFFNFGYFFRLQLLRAATESYKGDELGLISNYNQQRCKNFLKNTGISSIKEFISDYSGIIFEELNPHLFSAIFSSSISNAFV